MSQPTTLPFTTLDVFTNTPYAGNPLAIVHLPPPSQITITQAQKQQIAKEFNLSETVFLHPPHWFGEASKESGRQWQIDIFTPDEELPFAGHPTIGAASFVLALDPALSGQDNTNKSSNSRGTLSTKAGFIPISLSQPTNGEEGGFKVTAEVPFCTHLHRGPARSSRLAMRPDGFQSNKEIRSKELRSPLFSIVKGMTFLLVELEDLNMLGQVEMSGTAPDFMGEGCLEDGWREGFVGRYYYVLLSDSSPDVVQIRTRMVEAKMEDPATGSAACALSCYLAGKLGRSTRFEIEQGVEMGRRSVIGVEVDVDERGDVRGVRLSGSAVEIMRGEVRV